MAGETKDQALREHGKEKINSAVEHGERSSDKNGAEPPGTTKCLTSGDREHWQREQGHCHHLFTELWTRRLEARVEKMEMMLGKQAGGGMVNSLEDQARSFGFGTAGRDAHTRASVGEG